MATVSKATVRTKKSNFFFISIFLILVTNSLLQIHRPRRNPDFRWACWSPPLSRHRPPSAPRCHPWCRALRPPSWWIIRVENERSKHTTRLVVKLQLCLSICSNNTWFIKKNKLYRKLICFFLGNAEKGSKTLIFILLHI